MYYFNYHSITRLELQNHICRKCLYYFRLDIENVSSRYRRTISN